MLGEAATAEWHDQTRLTYTTLIDTGLSGFPNDI